MSVLQVVNGCPLFYELYDEEIMKIVESCNVKTLKNGDYVFREGDEGNEIFLVLNGSAHVMKNGVRIAKLRKGDLFGEMVLLKDNYRNADIYIESYADILVLDYDDIFGLYGNSNRIFSILILNLARMLATRLRKAGGEIERLKLKELDKAS